MGSEEEPECSLLSPFIPQYFPCSGLGWKCHVWSECILGLVNAVWFSVFTLLTPSPFYRGSVPK